MKKLFAIFMAVVLCIVSLAGCSSKKTEKQDKLAQQVYDNLCSAYSLVNRYGGDIYEAWRYAIDEDNVITFSDFSQVVSLTKTELKNGIVVTAKRILKKEITFDQAESFLLYVQLGDSFFSEFVDFVVDSYEANGYSEEIRNYMNDAKSDLKILIDQYPEYEYNADLRAVYTAVSQYFDYCLDPDGSFNSLKNTIANFRSDFGKAKANLDFKFGEFAQTASSSKI